MYITPPMHRLLYLTDGVEATKQNGTRILMEAGRGILVPYRFPMVATSDQPLAFNATYGGDLVTVNTDVLQKSQPFDVEFWCLNMPIIATFLDTAEDVSLKEGDVVIFGKIRVPGTRGVTCASRPGRQISVNETLVRTDRVAYRIEPFNPANPSDTGVWY